MLKYSDKIKNLLHERRKEMERCRNRKIKFVESYKDFHLQVQNHEENVDFVTVSPTDENKYYRLGELEIIPLEVMLTNPFDCKYRLTYEVISSEELPNIGNKKLPTLHLEDPIRIWYGWNPETLIRIKRPDGSYYYRQVR